MFCASRLGSGLVAFLLVVGASSIGVAEVPEIPAETAAGGNESQPAATNATETKPVATNAAETKPAATNATDAAPANSNLQREYARLAQLLNSTDTHGRSEAVDSLLKVRPSDVASADTRKLIARGFRSVALDGNSWDRDKAVKGLVIWGGKYSVPILIELLEKDKHGHSEELYDALGQLKDPQGAEAVAQHLGEFVTHEYAVNSLRKMGSAAEGALIKAAPSNNKDVSLAAVQLLGQVGSEKSNAVLQLAASSRNYDVKMAARESMKRIRERQKNGQSPDKVAAADPNSPFAEGSGPAVDISARNTRDYAENCARERQHAAVPGVPPAAGAASTDGATEEVADLNEGDWSHVNALLPGDPAGKGVPADPVKEGPAGAWKPQPVRLGNASSVHERPEAMSVSSGASPMAAVVYGDPFNKSIGRLETVNLRQRKSLGSSNVVGGVQQCYLSPSGTRVLMIGEEGWSNRKARLEVWTINGAKTTEEVTWWPFATSKGMWGSNEIVWADWVDDDQLLIVNGEGTTVLWRLEGKVPHAVYQIDADGRCSPALSPGRAHMALATPRGVEIFRATDGAILARMENVRPGAGRVAFNADGTKLACVSGKSIYTWDATTGKLERDFDCTNLKGGGDLAWLDNDHLLVGGTDVVDIQRRNILWRYEMPNLPGVSRGPLRWLLMQSNNIQGLVPAQLLQPEVLAAAPSVDPEAMLALKPGAKIALDIQVGGEEQQKAESAIRAAVERSGMQVASDSPIRISARIVTGQSETQEYGSGFFHRENREQVTSTTKQYEVELMIDGQSAWKTTSTIQSGGLPPVIWLKEGETGQQAQDREAAQRLAGFNFSASVPRYVVQPKYAGPLGTSKISLAGAGK